MKNICLRRFFFGVFVLFSFSISAFAQPESEDTLKWPPIFPKTEQEWYGAYESTFAQLSNPFHILSIDGKLVAFKEMFPEGIDDDSPSVIIPLKNFKIDGNKFFSDNWEGEMVMYNLNFRYQNDSPHWMQGLLVKNTKSEDKFFYMAPEVAVTASSFLVEKNRCISRYWPNNVLESYKSPTWAEGVTGPGIGEWLNFSFLIPKSVAGVRIVNGYAKSQDLFQKNSRVKQLEGITSSGETFKLTLEDTMNEQEFSLDLTEKVNWIKLTIQSVYKGSKYEDTCISKVNFNFVE